MPRGIPTDESAVAYEAQNLFNGGINSIGQLGKSDEAINLLKSLDSLQTRARLERAENQDDLVRYAHELWLHAPEVGANIMRKYPDAKRSSEQLTKLASSQEGASEPAAGKDQLLTTLTHEVATASTEDVRAATRDLLAVPALQTDGSPDAILAVWASALGENDPQILIDMLTSEDVNDEQSSRLYYRILENLECISSSQFLNLLKAILVVQEGREKTADAIIRSLGEVARHKFADDEQKRSLCEAVLTVYPDIPKRDRKGELAKICAAIGLKAAAIDGNYAERFTEEDLEIVQKFTGTIRS